MNNKFFTFLKRGASLTAFLAAPSYYTYLFVRGKPVSQLIDEIDSLQEEQDRARYQQSGKEVMSHIDKNLESKIHELQRQLYLTNDYRAVHKHAQGYKILQIAMRSSNQKIKHDALIMLNDLAQVPQYSTAIARNMLLGPTFSTITSESSLPSVRTLAASLIESLSSCNITDNHPILINWQLTFRTMSEPTAHVLANQTTAIVATRIFANQEFTQTLGNYTHVLPFTALLRYLFDQGRDERTREYAAIGLLFAQKKTSEAQVQFQKLVSREYRNQLLSYVAMYMVPSALVTSVANSVTRVPPTLSAMSFFTVLGSALLYGAVPWFKKMDRIQKNEDGSVIVPSSWIHVATMWTCGVTQALVWSRAGGGARHMQLAALVILPVTAEMYRYFGSTALNAQQIKWDKL